MIWKIETIEDNDQPIANKIIKNCKEMVASLEPSKSISQKKIYQITKLIDETEKLLKQGLYRNGRNQLRGAYKLLDKMNCKRQSGSASFQTLSENKNNWVENHLKKSLSEIFRK